MDIVDPFKLERPNPTANASSDSAAPAKSPSFVDPFKAPPLTGALADLEKMRPRPDAQPSSGFGVLDIPKEVLSGALQGTGSVVSGVGDVGRTLARPLVNSFNEVYGDTLPDPVNPLAIPGEFISGLGRRVADTESDAAKAAKEKPIVTGDITNPRSLGFGEGAKSPASIALVGAGLLGQIVPLLAGGIEARAAKLAPDVIEALPGIAAKLKAGTALTDAEHAIAATAAKSAKSVSQRTLATGAGIGGVQGAEGAAEAERQRIEGLSAEDLAAVPGYSERIAKGMTPDQARADLADAAGSGAFAATLPVATAAGLVSTVPLLHEAQGALSKVAGTGLVRRAATGAAAEAPVQAGLAVGQGAAETAGANAATGEDRSLTENSASEAGAGAALGALFGAGGAAATRPRTVRYPDAQPGTLADAANAVPVGEGKREAGAEGRESFTPPPATPAAPGSLSEAAEAMAPRAAPNVPWITPETDEFRRPTDDEIKDAFHQMFEAAIASGGGMQRTAASRMLAEEWGVPRDRLQQLRRDALAERNEGFKPGDKRPETPNDEGRPAAEVASADTGAQDEIPARAEEVEQPSLLGEPPTESQPIEIEGDADATRGREQPSGDQPEHPNGESGREETEPGGSDRAEHGETVEPEAGEAQQRAEAVARGVAEPEPEAPTSEEPEHDGAETPLREESLAPDRGPVGEAESSEPSRETVLARESATGSDAEAAEGRVDLAAREAAMHPENERPEPTDAQREAGNYAKGHVALHGLDVSIENPADTRRKPEWDPLANHYGYIRKTEGADGEHVDTFLGPHAEDPSKPVFVIDQKNPRTGRFDEQKVMLGFATGREARAAYQANYQKGWRGFQGITEMSLDQFKDWLRNGDTTKPAASAASPIQKGVRESREQLAARAKAIAAGNDRVLDSINPSTHGVFEDYRDGREFRATAPLAENMVPLAETQKLDPGAKLTIYRGVPAEHAAAGILPGDFVTTNRQTARDYAGTGRVIEKQVRYGDVLDDSSEPGGGDYIYRPQAAASLKAKEVRSEAARLARSIRTSTIPRETGEILARYRNDRPLKADVDYAAAKAGHPEAAARLVERQAPELAAQAKARFGSDVTFVAPHAEEATGKNAIPQLLAAYLAHHTGGRVDEDIVQSNRPRHTGARAMERLISRAEFDGPVEKGRKYVLVDDVSTSGGTFADLAHHIQSNGGEVAGTLSFVNAARSGKIHADERVARELERRHGDEIRKQFGIDPAALTAEEAKYLIGFRTADELRNRATAAAQERTERLRSKEVRAEAVKAEPEPAKAAPKAPPREGLSASGAESRPRDRILLAAAFDAKAATDMLGEKLLSRSEAVQALRDIRGDQTLEAADLAGIPSKTVGKAQKFDPVDVARAARAAWREARNLPNERGAREFRQAADERPAVGSAQRAAIHEAVNDVVRKWGPEAPHVRVVDSPEQLPDVAKQDPRYRSARGFYDGKTAYIVAGNHADPASALRSLAHEAVGHYGVDRIVDEFGKGGMNQLVADITRLRSEGLGSAAMKSVLADVARRYPGADERTFAREVIAVAAERGIRNGIVGRAVAAVKALLRKLFPNLTFSENDIRAMLSRSEEYLRSGPSLSERQEMVRAAAFDQPETAGLTPGERNNPATVADAARAWREEGTDSPYFRKFFGDSKVVDAQGKPRIVYHGTGEDFSVFANERAGTSTGHMTAPFGHFFAEDRAKAERYAEKASQGVPADERVIAAYLRITKPKEMTADEFLAVDSQDEARAMRAQLEREGYDGIHLKDFDQWIAFHPEQIKSAENRGTFDPRHGDINFSLPEASMDTLDEVLAKPDDTAFQRAKDWVRGKAEDLRPAALKALQTRHVLELMEQHPALKGAKLYGDYMRALDADRNQLMTGSVDAKDDPKSMLKRGGATIAQDLRDFTYEKGPAGWFGRRRPEAQQLADVMHNATIYGLDPSAPYQRLTFEDSRGNSVEWTQAGIKERIKEIRGQMRGRPGDDKSMMMEEVKRLRNIPRRENLRQQRWPDLVARYQALSDAGKKLYQQQRDWHAQMRDEMEIALIKRIEALGQDIGANYVRSLQDRIRLQFEQNRKEGVYFPLNRDGDFWVSFTDKEGQQGFKMFESAKDAAQAEKKLRAAGFTIEAQGRRDGDYRAKDAPSGTFVRDVVQMLKKAGASEKVQDDVYQLFLKSLPEMSMRKHSIHRRNVPGYSEDILRAFAKNAFHGSHQLARLRHAHEMQSVIEAMQASLDNYRRGSDLGGASQTSAMDVARGDALLGELKKRHDFIMSPKDTQLANVANSIGFLYYLGASPASAIVNLTQNAQVTLPVLAAHHGWGKASRMLGAAVRDSLKTGGNIDRTLKTEEERQAYNVMRARGDIDKTQSHTLAGLAEGALLTTNPVWAKTMSAMTYMFHKAEVVNREAAGVAAFRLARTRGDDFNTAVKYASDIINGTHFDYSAANRSRYMQGNTARIALQFKNYSVGMTWALYRNLYQAFKGETPEVRSIARKTLTGILGMTAVLAGSMGLPMINALRYGANAAHTLFGDDEPFDFDTEYRAWLAEHLGADAAKWVADGAVNRLGADVAGRTGLADLWFREPDRELEGRDAYYAMLESLAGPMGGLAKNFFVGNKMIADGNVQRGIETMLPKFVKDSVKALRFSHEGANTLRGDPIVPDVTGPESFIQALGFRPTRLAEQQRTNNAMKNYEQGILDRRATLLNTLAMASRQGDEDERTAALAKIHAFNQQYPEIALNSDSIRQSLRARARYSAQADNGIFINKKLAPRVREAVEGDSP